MTGRLATAHAEHVAVAGDVARLLDFLGLHAVPGVETWDGSTYSRALRLPRAPGVVTLTVEPGGAAARYALAEPADLPAARAAVAHLLGADDDPGPAHAALAGDPVLAPLVALRPGLLRPGSADHAETLLRTVLGQQVSLAGARTLTGRLAAAHGQPLPRVLTRAAPGTGASRPAVAPRDDARPAAAGSRNLVAPPAAAAPPVAPPVRCFPAPAALAGCDPADLPLPRSRGRAVVALAATLADDPGVVEDDAALLALPGIGPWTVAYARLRVRRDPDVFLTTDLAVRRQLEHLGHPGEPAAVAAMSRGWAPYRSTALLQLWTATLERRAARRPGP